MQELQCFKYLSSHDPDKCYSGEEGHCSKVFNKGFTHRKVLMWLPECFKCLSSHEINGGNLTLYCSGEGTTRLHALQYSLTPFHTEAAALTNAIGQSSRNICDLPISTEQRSTHNAVSLRVGKGPYTYHKAVPFHAESEEFQVSDVPSP